MTQEEKLLLLKDLCARLTYRPNGVKLNALFDPEDITVIGYTGRFVETIEDEIEVEKVRLYLRPMYSMTEEEANEVAGEIIHSNINSRGFVWVEDCSTYIDWLNAHHFDYRGLIGKGLAFEAPKDMYKTE